MNPLRVCAHLGRMLPCLVLLLTAPGCNTQGYALVTTVGAHPELESFTNDDSLAETKVIVLGDKLDCGNLDPVSIGGLSCADWEWRIDIFVPPAFQRLGDFSVGAEAQGQELLVTNSTCKGAFGTYLAGRVSILDPSASAVDLELLDAEPPVPDIRGKYIPVACR